MKKTVIFGECMVELTSKDASNLRKSFAGDTYNTAVYLKRCLPAHQVSFMSAIGEDFLSDELMLRMGDEQLGTEYVYRCSNKNLGLYMVRTDERGERTFAYWRSDSAAKQTIKLMNAPLEDVGQFYFSGISLAILDVAQRETLFSMLKEMRVQGTKIVFDPNYRARLWSSVDEARYWTDMGYQHANLAFPGADDHLMLYGHAHADDIFAHLKPFGIDELVVKNGAIGVQVQSSEGHRIVPVERIEQVVDTTAAGDAFNAGYLAARLGGQSETQSVSYAARVAATVIQFPGAIVNEQDFFQHVRAVS